MAIIESYGTYTLELSPDGTYQVDGHAIRHSDNIIYHYSNGGFIIAADTYDGVKAIVFDVAGGSSPYSSPDSYRVWYTNDSWTQSNTGPNGVSAVNLTPQEIVNTFGAVISGYIPEIPSEAPTAISIDTNSIIENSVGSVIGTLTVTDSDVDSYSPHGSTPHSAEVITPAAGATIGDEFQVNTYVSSDKTMPIITGHQ